jgi:hypothetical protein
MLTAQILVKKFEDLKILPQVAISLNGPRTNIRVTRGNYDIRAFYQALVRYFCDRYFNRI